MYLGIFSNFEDAVKARRAAEEKYFEPIKKEFEMIYGKKTT